MTWETYAALIALGAFHGLNPAMGWLFAVARGMQERSRRVMLLSLPPIAAGHLASVAIVAAIISATRSVVAANVVGIAGGALLVGFGLWRLLSERHFRWAGMRLSSAQLAGWSFLMSSAHGAGLMLLPVLTTTPVPGASHAGHAMPGAGAGGSPLAALTGLAAAGVHTVAMFTVMAGCALLVYEFLGVNILRRAWFNVDRLWAGVLVAAGALTIAITA
ncbi:membrane protein [Actinoplanes sp. SE50]|uniref:hypothetical protein n=1 Tax=unclassified Actinoplanes TaxID=2626549 RepID=UPI00023EC18E|nr:MULTISPECIES: hypothetical protein [unclassified Actinoplanes]AEV87517.1 hypothetical protein ACPL_6635 [Actinoplanes sp. SE50/110]ATO85920.1 membrane protein [Actinoplanes sp. SE50]SLM03334.1 membrane protein [Actinoplanes sp. SE50/110]